MGQTTNQPVGQPLSQQIGQPGMSAPGLGPIHQPQRLGDAAAAQPSNASGAPGLQQRYQVPMPFTPRYSSFRHNMPPGPAPGVGPVQVMGGSHFNQGLPPGMPPPPMGQLHSMPQQPIPGPIQNQVPSGYPVRAPSMSGSAFSMPGQATLGMPAPSAGAAPPPGTAAGTAGPAGNSSSTTTSAPGPFSPGTGSSTNPLLAVLASGQPNTNGSGAKGKPESNEKNPASVFASTKGHPNFELLGALPVPPLTVTPANGRESLASVLPGLGPDTRLRKREGSTVAVTSSSLFDASSKSVPLLESLGIDDKEDEATVGSEVSSDGTGVRPATAAPTMAASLAKKPEIDSYGLKPLASVLRTENGERSPMILDTDVTLLGLNLNDPNERISRTFASPWVEASKHCVVTDFSLPECYTVRSAVPQQQKLQNLTEETLFYIFYTMPRDAMQEAAAVELTNRNWRYHKELKLWLTKDPMSDPVQQTAQAESGIYVFFDPISWEKVKKEYYLYYPDIA